MRTASHTVDLDDVGAVEATVDERGRFEGLGAISRPTPRRVPHRPPRPRYLP